jgi:hypothetical protein
MCGQLPSHYLECRMQASSFAVSALNPLRLPHEGFIVGYRKAGGNPDGVSSDQMARSLGSLRKDAAYTPTIPPSAA